MAKLLDGDSAIYLPFQCAIARFLAQFDPCATSAYSALIEAIEPHIRHTEFASLNYDVMLERAAQAREWGVDYGLGQRIARTVKVIKPHGSANFLPKRMGSFHNVSVVGTGSVFDGDIPCDTPLGFLEIAEWISSLNDGDIYTPVMSAYAKGKWTPVGARLVTEQRVRWEASAQRSVVVIVVGVAVNPEDEHIWQPLARTNAPVYYVDPNPGPFFEWAAKERVGKRSIHLGERFGDSIESIAAVISMRQA